MKRTIVKSFFAALEPHDSPLSSAFQ